MNQQSNAYLLGGGIDSLAAAAFMIRDGGLSGKNIFILEAKLILGGSLDGAGNPVDDYSLWGGRMLTTDNYECTWDLYKSIPSLSSPDKTVFDVWYMWSTTFAFQPWHSLERQQDPETISNFHTPTLALDNLYGTGPSDPLI